MILHIFYGHFLYAKNLKLMPCFLRFVRLCILSSTCPLCPSNATMAVSSTTKSSTPLPPHTAYTFVFPAHILLNRTGKLNVSSARLMTLCVLSYFRPAYRHGFGSKPYIQPLTSSIAYPQKPSTHPPHTLHYITLIHPIHPFVFSVVYAIPIPHPPWHTNCPLVPVLVFFSVTLLTIRDTVAWTLPHTA